MSKNGITDSPVVYETDNLENASNIKKKYPGVGVIYHNTSEVPPPFLTFKTEGRTYTKCNPDYIEYLKIKYPSMNEKEIMEHMQKLYQPETCEHKRTI